MGKCQHCPITDGPCRSEVDPRYAHLCERAATGSVAHLTTIRVLSGQPSPPKPEYPSLGRQALNLAGSIATHVRAGGAKVDDATLARRLAICEACPIYDAGHCRKCGCRMERKARWAAMACPLGYWDREDAPD